MTQDPLACSVTLDTTGLGSPFGSAASSGTIGVTANGPNCSWTASSDVTWATLAPTSGTGNGTLTVSVGSNAASTTARTGVLTIAGQSVGLSQAGTDVHLRAGVVDRLGAGVGGAASVRVIAPAAAAGGRRVNAAWLTITSSGSAGTSGVQFSAAPNPSATPGRAR